MAEEVPRLMTATKKTTGELMGIIKSRENEMKNCREVPREIQDFSFPDAVARYYHRTGKMLAPFTNL